MVTAKVRDGKVDKAVRDLKRKMSNSLIPSKVKSKQSFEKKGARIKREKKENTINWKKRNRGNY